MAEKERGGSLARTVFGGAGMITAAGVVSRLFGLVSSPILTRVLGPAPYGEVALVGTVTSLATTLALFGVDMSYARYFFSGSPEEGVAVERFCWRFSAGASFCVALVAGAAWWWLGPIAGQPSGYAIMVGAGILLGASNTMASLRRRVRSGYARIAASIAAGGGIGMVLAIVFALTWRRDAWALLLGTGGGIAASVVILGLPGASLLRQASHLPRTYRWEVVRLGLTSMVTAPMFWVMSSADRWFLGMWKGEGELGIYAFAGSIGMVGIMLNNAITMTWFPEMNRTYEAMGEESSASIGRIWARLVASLLVVWVAVSASGGDILRLFTDPRFHGGARLVPWLAGAIFFYGVTILANTGLFLRKDLTPVVGWWIAGAAVNVTLNVVLVPWAGAMGSSVAACVGFALIASGVTWSSQKRFRLQIPWGRLSAAGCISVGSIAVMSIPWSSSPLGSLFLKLPAGGTCALTLMMIVAPDWMRRLFRDRFRSSG